jgi:carbonic anhydrase/acetyltransferase-like protein (isoleucine patch superfamily)
LNLVRYRKKFILEPSMPIYSLADADLEVEDENAFWVAPNAILVGRIVMKKNASVWPGCVIRADNDVITIGENTNIQDGSVLHTDEGIPMTIGANCTIGHMVMLHGCTIEDNALIGIKSTILNNARIGPYNLVGAHALVTERKVFPGGELITGVPAKAVRPLDDAAKENIDGAAQRYVANWKRFKRDMKLSPLNAKT